MATRSTTHFVSSFFNSRAIIYVHHDGYPSEGGERVLRFLETVRDKVPQSSTRFNDNSLTATRFAVFMFHRYLDNKKAYPMPGKNIDNYHVLDTISVAVVDSDPGDIEYRYIVLCDEIEEDGTPKVIVESVWDGWKRDAKDMRAKGWI